ncbi:MAG: hypothetical protein AVDCRST_MAG38-176, partial [uncultured Solirubrobacteraceae bacterium]
DPSPRPGDRGCRRPPRARGCRRAARRGAAAPRDRAAAVRGWRRLVREPVEPAEPHRRRRPAHRAPDREGRGAGLPRRRAAVGLPVPAHDRARERPLHRRGGRPAARVHHARRLPARRRQLRAGRELPPRDRPRVPGTPPRGRPAFAPDLPRRVRPAARRAQGARARRQAGARLRHLHRRPARRVLHALRRPRERLGGPRHLRRPARAPRGRAADGRQP